MQKCRRISKTASGQNIGNLCKKEGGEVYVAVRSSATAEDLPDASFAGQQDTFLNMKGEQNVIDAVKKCWASLYGARAIYYRVKQGFDHSKVNLCAVVQMMVEAEKAGVMFSSHPSTGEPLTIIEGAWGLGRDCGFRFGFTGLLSGR